MAKSARTGEMRTRIRVVSVTHNENANGFAQETEADVFPDAVWCKWVWAYGTEALENMRLKLGETATATLRYTDGITPRCRIYLTREGNNAKPFEVVSVNPVEEARKYLEIRVRRDVKA